MGGVWVFLNPYISDFEDNTNWNAANGIADRLEDRINVAAILRMVLEYATNWGCEPQCFRS